MLVGLSVILAFLSYLIYRRLSSAEGTSPSSKNLPMWPFLSTFIKQPPKPPSSPPPPATLTPPTIAFSDFEALPISESLSPPSTCASPQKPSPASSAASTPQLGPSSSSGAPSPDATPKTALSATHATQTLAIPTISLDGERDWGAGGGGEPGGGGGGSNADDDDDDDAPPSFLSMNSAQRASGGISSLSSLRPNSATSAPSIAPPATATLTMRPPPIPFRGRNPRAKTRLISPGVAAPSAAATQRQNASSAARSRLSAVGLGASGVASGNGLSLPNQRGRSSSSSRSPSSNKRKIILEPGHSPLDWARLQRSGVDLRGLSNPQFIKVPPSMLAAHSKPPSDIWTALNGRVYNITAYLPFHPGGEKDLLRGAGKDCTKLFNATHPWVNVESMLAECLIGVYVSEEEVPAATDG